MNTKLCAATGAALLTMLVSSAPGFAQGKGAQPSVLVRYSDLDLSTSTGIRTLYQRIRTAAWQVCLQIAPAHNASSSIENAKCRETLVDSAVGEVNRPALTALHEGRKPASLTAAR